MQNLKAKFTRDFLIARIGPTHISQSFFFSLRNISFSIFNVICVVSINSMLTKISSALNFSVSRKVWIFLRQLSIVTNCSYLLGSSYSIILVASKRLIWYWSSNFYLLGRKPCLSHIDLQAWIYLDEKKNTCNIKEFKVRPI